ncbi:MAG: FHA domain-containing protein [Myxococcota bacterium]
MTVRFALRCQGRELPLENPLVLLGSDPDCDICLKADGVRPRHIVFRVEPGRVRLETTQGMVHVNGVEIPHSVDLTHGAMIQAGIAKILFVDYHEGDNASRTTSRATVSVSLSSALDALAELDDAIEDEDWTLARDRLSALAVDLPPEITQKTMIDALARSAASIARGTGNPTWINWLLELCRTYQHVPSSGVVDLIAEAAPRAGWRGGPVLDAFTETMKHREALEQVRVRRLHTIARAH